MSKILWLHSPKFSGAQRSMLENYMRKADVNPANAFFLSMHMRVQNMWIKKGKTKNKFICNPTKKEEFFNALDGYIDKINPKVIVVNDVATLGFVTGYTSLDLCRGSVYGYRGVPVIVIDDVLKARTITHGPWVLLSDLRKLRRWSEDERYPEPKFDYRVCHTVADLQKAKEYLNICIFIASDIETKSEFLSCIGYTGISNQGRVITWVIPLFNPTKLANAHWDSIEDEVIAWETIRDINDNDAIKCFQNGQYDCSYLVRYRVPPRNYIADTLHLWHSIWTESPKKLNFIASMVLDHCRYWKDEIKGEKKEQTKADHVPNDWVGIEMYWRYNALDCHNTALAARYLLQFISQEHMTWARQNYNIEFSLQMGPAMAMSMRGMKMNRKRQLFKLKNWMSEHFKALDDVRTMVDDQDFNPGSPSQVASLIYDVLGATPIKKRGQKTGSKGTGEGLLKLIRIQHPVFAAYIDAIWAVKKPKNNASKYGEMRSYNGRFMYALSAAGTETGRFNSKAHHFWLGNNSQNINRKIRDMFQADEGYILVDADYSQSDSYFVAFECEDEKMMANITDDRDTHAVHAEFFFKKPYDDIMANLKEDWVSHPTKGVRQNTKRVTHGANYRMAAFTLYMTMGHEAVVGSAQAMGYADAHKWSQNKLVNFCDQLLKAYIKLYDRLPVWFAESVQEAVANGNRVTCFGGRTRLFFGNLVGDQKLQRELSAYYGQGGTSGNINRTLLDVFYKTDLEKRGLMLLNQVHDSIMFQVPVNKLELINEFLTIMAQPCIVRGREFTVPAEAELGFSWKGSYVDWDANFVIEHAIEAEKKCEAKYHGK